VRQVEATLQGVAAGLLVGGVIFVATNVLVLKGGPVVGPHLVLLGQFFVGYEVTFVGSVIGFAWGFVYGFLAGWGGGVVYNRVAAARRHPGRPVGRGPS
jgi:hypothetical protein